MDKTLGQMDKVIGFHHVADDVEGKVQDGPNGDVEPYIKVYMHTENKKQSTLM